MHKVLNLLRYVEYLLNAHLLKKVINNNLHLYEVKYPYILH